MDAGTFLILFGRNTSASTVGILLSASQDTEGDAQGTAIGTLSVVGGTGTYTFTLTDDGGGTTQVAGTNGVNLQVGATAPVIGTVSIGVHADNGAGSTFDATFTIGTVPNAPILDLAAASDSGSSSTDNITNDNTPEIDATFGSNLQTSDLYEVKDGGTTIVSHTVSSGEAGTGVLNLDLSPLSDGAHSLSARLSRGSLVSAWGPVLSITIKTNPPVLSSLSGAQDGSVDTQADLSVTTDTGQGTIWWVVSTNGTTPTVSQIKAGEDASGATGTDANSFAVSSSGVKTFTASISVSGTYFVHVLHEDTAGNDAVATSPSWVQTITAGFDPASLFPGNGGYWNVALARASGKLWQDTAGTIAAVANNDPVARCDDLSGNAHHLLQATSANRPTLQTDGTYWWLQFNGSTQSLAAAFTFAQPATRVTATRAISFINGGGMWDGDTAEMMCLQSGTTPTVLFRDGGVSGANSTAITIGVDHTVAELYNGATGKFRVDSAAFTTLNTGVLGAGGKVVGARQSNGFKSNIRWYGAIDWSDGTNPMSDANISKCVTFFGNLAGLSVS